MDNSTPSNLIREYLIKSHGNPGISQQGAYTVQVKNPYLDSFNAFEAAFNKLLKKADINPNDYAEAINTMYSFFYEAEFRDTKKITSHINMLNRTPKENFAPVKEQLIKFFNDVLQQKSRPYFTPYKLRILFELDLEVIFNNGRALTHHLRF